MAKKLRAQPFLARFAGKKIEKRASKPAGRLENIKQVCYVGEIGESLPHPVPEEKAAVGADGKVGLKEVTGRKRSLRADLAVLDDLSRLHECPDEATVSQVLAIVARGLPVVYVY